MRSVDRKEKEKMSSKIPSEGILSGISRVRLEDVEPPDISDETWTEAGKVEELFIYPVKSMRGVSVQSADVGKHGLSCGKNVDRQFMIVTETDKRMITARRYPRIVLISAYVDDNKNILTLSTPEMSDINVDIPMEVPDKVETDVFESACKGHDMGDSVAKWISKFVLNEEIGLRLITHFMPSMQATSRSMFGLRKIVHPNESTTIESSRQHHASAAVKPFVRPDDVPLYADGFGYFLLAEESVNKLNERLKDNNVHDLVVEKTRFRPNIYVSGTKSPFEEDKWLYVRIGNCLFRNSALCDRCVFTTVDPETGIKHPTGEPLKTLKQFRSSLNPQERKAYGDSPFFGINLGVDKCGTIKVGDKIYIGEPIPKRRA